MITANNALFDSQLVVVEELFEKSRLGVLIKSTGDEGAIGNSGASFADGVDLNLLLHGHPAVVSCNQSSRLACSMVSMGSIGLEGHVL